MQRDLRDDPRYAGTLEFFRAQLEPALGQVSEALDVHIAPGDTELAISAVVWPRAGGLPAHRIGLARCSSEAPTLRAVDVTVLDSAGEDLLPRWSPDGSTLAFASDRASRGWFQLYFVDAATFAVTAHAASLNESIEAIAWAPDGTALLLQTVGRGADRPGAAGSGALQAGDADGPDWLPTIETAVPENLWRRLWIYRPADASLEKLGPSGLTFWEAAWSGPDAVIAVASDNPREGAWHEAKLVSVERATGSVTTLHVPREEIGLPVGTADGRFVAAVEACCSDRTVIAGDAIVFDRAGGDSRSIDTRGVNVTHLAVKGAATLIYAGLRGLETVVGEIDCASGIAREMYATRETFGRRYPAVTPTPSGGYAAVVHSYARPPAIVRIESGRERVLVDLAHDGYAAIRGASSIEEVRWTGRDGLAIEGLLVQPPGDGPHPLVVMIHGGPVWAFTNAWQMYYKLAPFLAAHGYAMLHPNPRGSGGRGQTFARMVRGDMNGEDTYDIIAGVEMLVARGVADPARLAVTGGSYGGMMASWIVTQTDMFAAAIPVAPVTDMVSQHFTSNIPNFDALFFADDPTAANGKHVTRSAIRYAKNVRTPTLNIAGGADRCTPPTQALEFHRALVEAGVTSELVIYPLEGHGVRQFEAFVDYATRILEWLDRHTNANAARVSRAKDMVRA